MPDREKLKYRAIAGDVLDAVLVRDRGDGLVDIEVDTGTEPLSLSRVSLRSGPTNICGVAWPAPKESK